MKKCNYKSKNKCKANTRTNAKANINTNANITGAFCGEPAVRQL